MAISSVTTIVVDLDGVVLEKSCFAARLHQRFGIPPEKTAPFFKEPFHRCQLGQSDLKTEVSPFLSGWGWGDSIDSFLAFWFACDSAPQVDVLMTLRDLRIQGLKCCLATNQERHRVDFLRENLAIDADFDNSFFSVDLGFRKPADGFFAAIENHLRLSPHEILFIDDSEENIFAAQKRGWIVHLYTGVAEFRNCLQLLARKPRRESSLL
jgi:putative hydrolase of the HAD superfamily